MAFRPVSCTSSLDRNNKPRRKNDSLGTSEFANRFPNLKKTNTKATVASEISRKKHRRTSSCEGVNLENIIRAAKDFDEYLKTTKE